jgi:hypothetical protein
VFQESSKAKLASFISVAHISQLLLGIIKILDNERVLHSFAIITYLASFFSIASSSNITKTSHLSKSTRNYQARKSPYSWIIRTAVFFSLFAIR